MPETLVVQAEIAELARVWDWANALGQTLGVSQSTLFAIHLCFEEALSNIIQYGFASGVDMIGRNKDVHLALGDAGHGRFETLAALAEEWEEVVGLGYGEDDLTIVAEVLEQQGGRE